MTDVLQNNAGVLVLGGTGHYGRHIVRRLAGYGASVAVLTRDPEAARELFAGMPTAGGSVAFIEGDITDPACAGTLAASWSRVVVALSGFAPRTIRRMREIEHDAVIRLLTHLQDDARVVILSAYEPRAELIDRFGFEAGRVKRDLERAVSDRNVNWTILGAAFSMALFFRMIRGSRMVVPGGGRRRIPVIAAEDVGEVAAQAVLRDDLAGMRVRIPGPAAYSFPEAAATIASACATTVRHTAVPLLPLRIAAVVSRPLNPFLANLLPAIRLFNEFPADLTESVPRDHARLRVLFTFEPVTLQEKAQSWCRT